MIRLPNSVLFKAMSLRSVQETCIEAFIWSCGGVHRPAVLNHCSTAIERLVCERHAGVCLTVKLAAGGEKDASRCHIYRRQYDHVPCVRLKCCLNSRRFLCGPHCHGGCHGNVTPLCCCAIFLCRSLSAVSLSGHMMTAFQFSEEHWTPTLF